MKKFLLAVCVLFASVVGADAAMIPFTSSAAFFTALGATPSTTETYEGLAANSTISPGDTVNGITYVGFPTGSIGRIDATDFNSLGAQSLALTGVTDFFLQGQSIDVSFAPTTAIGIFFNVFPSDLNTLFIQTAAGSAGNGAVYHQSTLYFVGLISDTPFSAATIGATGGASSGYNLDNLTLATAATAVPEPASMLLLGSGLLALRMRARRPRP